MLHMEAKERLGGEGPDPVDQGGRNEGEGSRGGDPGDMGVGMGPPDSPQQDGRPEDVSQGAGLEDQNPEALGGIFGAALAGPGKTAGTVPDIVAAVESHREAPLSGLAAEVAPVVREGGAPLVF
jgi:hypothetical protein